MTGVPPGETAEWYHPAKLCRLCRAKVLNRIEGVVPQLRVLHEDSCTSSPGRAIEAEGSRRTDSGRAGRSARQTRVSSAPAPASLEVI